MYAPLGLNELNKISTISIKSDFFGIYKMMATKLIELYSLAHLIYTTAIFCHFYAITLNVDSHVIDYACSDGCLGKGKTYCNYQSEKLSKLRINNNIIFRYHFMFLCIHAGRNKTSGKNNLSAINRVCLRQGREQHFLKCWCYFPVTVLLSFYSLQE